MAVFSHIYILTNGTFNRVELATSGFQFQADSFLVGATSPVAITQAVATNLLALQAGGDIGSTLHTHDSIYYRKTELNSATGGTAGTTLIGDNNSYTNFTPASTTLKAALTAIDTALSGVGGTSFQDSVFRIYDNGDSTKRIAFEASGIATSTIRTITVPNADVDLGNLTDSNISPTAAIARSKLAALTANRALISDGSGFDTVSSTTATQIGYLATTTSDVQIQIDGKVSKAGDTMSGSLNMSGNSITSLAAPSSGTDAANKNYVDAAVTGLSWKIAVKAASTANLTLSGTQTVDGIALIANDRILVKNQSTGANNGVYLVAAGAWTRSTDADTAVELDGAAVFVTQGTANADTAWVQTADNITLGTTALVFTQFSGNGTIQAGTALSYSGNTLNVNLGSGITTSSNALIINNYSASGLFLTVDGTTPSNATAAQLSIFLDGATLARSSSGLKITAGGVTATELATDSVTTVKILNANVTLGKLAAQSVDDSKLVTTSNVYKSSTKTMLAAEDTNHYHQSVQYNSLTAGEGFASGAVYFGYMADAAGSARLFKATNDRSGGDKFDAFLAVKMTTTVATAGTITEANSDHIYVGGIINFPGTPFATGDVGKAVYLGTSGTFTLTPPAVETTSGLALVKLGNVISTTVMSFRPQVIAVS